VRRFVRALRPDWIGAGTLLWAVVAWRLAGELGSLGWTGLVAGVVLLAATAWACVRIRVRNTPALRKALADEPTGVRVLRAALAWPCLLAGLLLLGVFQVESWERGTLHYRSDARRPQSIFAPAPAETDALLRLLTPGSLPPVVERVTTSASYDAGIAGIGPGQACAAGLLLLVAFGAALVLRAPGAPGAPDWMASARPVLVMPVLLLLGLLLTGLWSDLHQQAEDWPGMVAVSGTSPSDLGVEAAGAALRRTLHRDGYAAHAEVSTRLVTASGAEPAHELDLAFEPRAPWNRWDLEDGLPRRRRPHVALRIVGDTDRCVVAWDCGVVRPLASEPDAWRDWMQHVLQDALRSE
jgi:hypothetical protein